MTCTIYILAPLDLKRNQLLHLVAKLSIIYCFLQNQTEQIIFALMSSNACLYVGCKNVKIKVNVTRM